MNITLKKLILFSALTVLMGVSVVYALGYEFKPQNSSQTLPTTQGVYDGFQLTMTLEKTEYSLGEPINITLTITNISNHTITYGYADPNSYFRVYNETNNDIYNVKETQLFLDIVVFVPINAGESLTDHYVWQQMCNVTLGSEGVPVSPGTYYIVGKGSGGTGFVETTPIQVAIAAP